MATQQKRNDSWKRSLPWYFCCSMVLILLAWAGIIQHNREMVSVEQGDVLTEVQVQDSARLVGWEKRGEIYHFQLKLGTVQETCALFIFSGQVQPQVWCNGKKLEMVDEIYLLPAEVSLCELEIESENPPTAYIAKREVILSALHKQMIGSWSVTLVMVFMTLYILSLYLFKSSESYLWDLYFYQLIVLVWAVARFMPETLQKTVLWSLFSRYFVWILVVATLKYSVNLVADYMPSWVNRMMTWPKVLLWAGTISLLASHWSVLRVVVNVSFYILCVGVLSYAVARRVRGSGWLLIGMIARVALFPMVLFASLPAVAAIESLGSYLMRRVPLADLPFMLGAMFFVNQKFAHQFTESERLAQHLDELVSERTRELEQAHAERQSMILNITHDLRTPLFVIKNCLGVVEENPQALPEMLPILQQRSEFVSSLTEDLFLLVKLEEGKLMLNQQREDLSQLLEELSRMSFIQAEEKKIRLTQDLLPEVYVWGDRVRLQQIFQNLITNAFHYTPSGGEISVRMELLAKDVVILEEGEADFPGYVRVTVRDSGKGISPADAEHIFDRYFHTKAENKHDSSGLGLSIAKELTLLHHGTIDFTSEEGEGTEFCVTLPLC